MKKHKGETFKKNTSSSKKKTLDILLNVFRKKYEVYDVRHAMVALEIQKTWFKTTHTKNEWQNPWFCKWEPKMHLKALPFHPPLPVSCGVFEGHSNQTAREGEAQYLKFIIFLL